MSSESELHLAEDADWDRVHLDEYILADMSYIKDELIDAMYQKIAEEAQDEAEEEEKWEEEWEDYEDKMLGKVSYL